MDDKLYTVMLSSDQVVTLANMAITIAGNMEQLKKLEDVAGDISVGELLSGYEVLLEMVQSTGYFDGIKEGE
jgi:cell division protein ZapA (FtsZ GTPase activity inhibitor)